MIDRCRPATFRTGRDVTTAGADARSIDGGREWGDRSVTAADVDHHIAGRRGASRARGDAGNGGPA